MQTNAGASLSLLTLLKVYGGAAAMRFSHAISVGYIANTALPSAQ